MSCHGERATHGPSVLCGLPRSRHGPAHRQARPSAARHPWLEGPAAGGRPLSCVAAPCRRLCGASRRRRVGVMPRFAVAFDRAASFRGRPGNQPLVLRGDDGVIGLTMLQDAVGTALEMAGLGPPGPHYTPPLTLLYGDRFVADHPVEPVGWTVHEFVLVHSLLGRSRYLLVARFPLGAQA